MPELIPFPDDLAVDADGYPSEAALAQLAHANDLGQAAHWMVTVFPRLVTSMPFGVVELFDGVDDFGHKIKLIAYSTRGWSGQESLVGALEAGPIGWLYLWAWQRGGHYEFRVPVPAPVSEPAVANTKATC